jgi:hypothetical protein
MLEELGVQINVPNVAQRGSGLVMIKPYVYRPLTKEDWLDFMNTPIPPPKPPVLHLFTKAAQDAWNEAVQDYIKKNPVIICSDGVA